jgi:hypothetical protein
VIAETYLRRCFRRVDEAQMKLRWKTHYEFALEGCQHGSGCQRGNCMDGNRVRLQPFVAGCILPMWDMLANFQGLDKKSAIKICRVRINDGDMRGQRLVGIKVNSTQFSLHVTRLPVPPKLPIKVTTLNLHGQPVEGRLARRDVASPEREQRTTRAGAAAAARSSLPRRVSQLGDDDDELVVLPEAEPRRQPARQRRAIIVVDDEDPPDV